MSVSARRREESLVALLRFLALLALLVGSLAAVAAHSRERLGLATHRDAITARDAGPASCAGLVPVRPWRSCMMQRCRGDPRDQPLPETVPRQG